MYRDKKIVRHPETCSLARLTKDLAVRRIFAAYIRRIAALLLRAKDLDDQIGLSHPFAVYLRRIAALTAVVPRP